jgi:uncharacterized protein with PQ loop repeat
MIGSDLRIMLGQDVIYDGDFLITLWWALLCIGSCVNLIAIFIRLANVSCEPYQRKMTYCSAVYVVGCAVRSIWPRVDVERTCFWDSRISVTFVGRILATMAEICFVAQLSMTIGVLAQEVKFYRTKRMADVFFWAICVAQCCCWMGVTTQRQIWHGLEESIWAMTFTGIATSCAILYRNAHQKVPNFGPLGLCESGELGYAKRCLALGFPISVVFVLFMVFVDVPMYVARYRADEARGASYLWVSEGVLDSMACRRISKSTSDWVPEMPWMTGYFLGATAISLWLSWGPEFKMQAHSKIS